MAKSKKRYFKLGKAAASYTDPGSGLVIRGGETVSIDEDKIVGTNKHVSEALLSGHIVEVEPENVGDNVTELPVNVPEPKPKKLSEEDKEDLNKELEDQMDEEEEDEDGDEDDKKSEKKDSKKKKKK